MSRAIRKIDGVYRCLGCGQAVSDQARPYAGACGCAKALPMPAPLATSRRGKRGLGDMVAFALSAIGITKDRVSKAIGKPCGCAKRQAALNQFGRKIGIG